LFLLARQKKHGVPFIMLHIIKEIGVNVDGSILISIPSEDFAFLIVAMSNPSDWNHLTIPLPGRTPSWISLDFTPAPRTCLCCIPLWCVYDSILLCNSSTKASGWRGGHSFETFPEMPVAIGNNNIFSKSISNFLNKSIL
jgi:hypothetical protein